MNIKSILKTSVAATALLAVAAPVSAEINNGNGNSLVMSGQIARSMVYQDNGDDTALFNVDGIDTNSRLRWIASGKMTESVTVGGIVEMNFPLSNSVYELGDDTDSTGDKGGWGFRKTEVTFQHKSAGKLSIGQNSAAGDGAQTQTLGSWGPSMSAYGKGGAGASRFWDANADELSDFKVSAVTGGFNLGRNDRIRYDTPSMGGLKLAVSYGGDAGSGIEATYAGKFGSVGVAAAVMYQRAKIAGTDGSQRIRGGSVAVKHDSGLSFHVGHSRTNSNIITLAGADTLTTVTSVMVSELKDAAIEAVAYVEKVDAIPAVVVDGKEITPEIPAQPEILAVDFEPATYHDPVETLVETTSSVDKELQLKSKEWHVGIGYAANLNNLGVTGFGINYAITDHTWEDQEATGTTLGLAVNQNIASVGADVFLAYNYTTFNIDDADADFEDFSVLMAGTRLNF